MIYVIGVDHKREQYPHSMNEAAKVERLKNTVRDICHSKNIRLIAEEWCDDARRAWSVATTHTEDAASELGIKHLPCDPGISERAALGLKTRDQIAQELGLNIYLIQENSKEENVVNNVAQEVDQKREQYWLDKFRASGYVDQNVLLICGYGHVDSFVALAKARGFDAESIPRSEVETARK